MTLNPFKDSNLESLQQNIKNFLSTHFGFILDKIKDRWNHFLQKGKERITIMLIPHSEKKIINMHIPIYMVFIIISIIIITITVTSLAIVNHTSTIKDITKLKKYGVNSKIQITEYKKEINRLYDIFQKLKPEMTNLYSLTHDKKADSLWAKGGVGSQNPESDDELGTFPPIEVLNIKEMEQELKTTKDVLERIKDFLESRKKIIENTPSLWPVQGYIISKFGMRTSPYTFQKEYSQGLEIAAFPGSEIRATAPGKVVSITWDSAYGLSIQIKHKYGFSTRYSHCQRIAVEIDQKVSKGELIGYVGRTGNATRNICYYQVKIGTDYVDPLPYLNKLSR